MKKPETPLKMQARRHVEQLRKLQEESVISVLKSLRLNLASFQTILARMNAECPEALNTREAREQLAELKIMTVRVQALIAGQP